MFLHLSVILFTGWWGQLPSMHHRSHDQWGLDPGGSASGGGGWADLPQVCLHGGGDWINPQSAYRVGAGQTPRDTWDTMGYGQRVGGTHSTGMHSCYIWISMCGVLFEFS